MSSSPFQITGVASGIGWDEIIDEMIKSAGKPKEQWQSRIDTLELKKSLYQEVQSSVYTMRSTMTTLKLPSAYKKKTAEFTIKSSASNTQDANGIVKATVNANAEIAQWDIDVKQLAESERIVSNRYADAGAALGISGKVRIQVGIQVATLEITADDSIRTINQKINNLTAADGSSVAVSAQLIDNRLVITGALTGRDEEGPLAETTLIMYDSLEENGKKVSYLPRPSAYEDPDSPTGVKQGNFPPQIMSISSGDTSYTYGMHYTYDSKNGKITWLTATRPADGAEISVKFSATVNGSNDSGNFDIKTVYIPDGKISTAGGAPDSANYTNNYNAGAQTLNVVSASGGAAQITGVVDISTIPNSGTKIATLPGGASFDPAADLSKLYRVTDANGAVRAYGTDYEFASVVDDSGVEQQVIVWKVAGDVSSFTLESLRETKQVAALDTADGAGPTELNDVAGISSLPTLAGQLYGDLPGSPTFDKDADLSKAYVIYNGDGKKLVYGKDYTFAYVEDNTAANAKRQVIVWKGDTDTGNTVPPSSFKIAVGSDNGYYVSNRQMHLIEDDPTSNDSVLAALGITQIKHDETTGDPYITWTNRTFAQDAKLTLNGVNVTRPTNQIPVEDDESDALIANVKLELTGVGHVVMNVTQDANEIIENLQKFVDAYNDLLELVNFRLTESAAKTSSGDDDTLSSILENTKGDTSFGLLHGDSLLWSVKNQMRNLFSNSIASVSAALRSRKVLDPSSALGSRGSFYINVGGMVGRLNVESGDSLYDIQRKLNAMTAINGKDGSAASGKDLSLTVNIKDGQLIIERSSKISGTGNENHTIMRSATDTADSLSFVPYMSGPVNGVLTIRSGTKTYVEGRDYEIKTFENDNGVYESQIVWTKTGDYPKDGTSYSVAYEYDAAGVGFTQVSGQSSDLTALDFHFDSSKIQLSNYGFSTSADDYGKSGQIEFDQDKFFEAITEDPNMVSNVMLSFMSSMDTYIGNLVDSSSILVGGNVVTKGRFAAAINRIDSEVNELQERITNLEKQLEEKQNSLYKQYSAMEQSIQTMNAQMSSLASYLSNSSGGGNSQQ